MPAMYSAGQTLTLTLYGSEAVTVSGTPSFDAQRRWYCDLHGRLWHQCVDFHLHSRERSEYVCARCDGTSTATISDLDGHHGKYDQPAGKRG